jgi:hypothetical protein
MDRENFHIRQDLNHRAVVSENLIEKRLRICETELENVEIK